MIVVIFLCVSVALLVLGGVFAYMAKDNKRKNQSGSPNITNLPKEGRAPGLD
jgi:hypothetical protein